MIDKLFITSKKGIPGQVLGMYEKKKIKGEIIDYDKLDEMLF